MNTESEIKTTVVAGWCFLIIAVIVGIAFISAWMHPEEIPEPQSRIYFGTSTNVVIRNERFKHSTPTYWANRLQPATNTITSNAE